MDQVLFMAEEQDPQDAHAQHICVQVGVLARCEKCLLCSPNADTATTAYKFGNVLYSKNDPLVKPFGSRTEMTDAIQKAFRDAEVNGECQCNAPYNTMKGPQ